MEQKTWHKKPRSKNNGGWHKPNHETLTTKLIHFLLNTMRKLLEGYNTPQIPTKTPKPSYPITHTLKHEISPPTTP